MGAHYPEMIVHRTTKVMVRRASRAARIALLVLAATVLAQHSCLAASFDDSDLSVRLVSESSNAPQWPPDLVISGTWPNACLPSVSRSTLTDMHIDVELRSSGSHCAAVPTPLSLKLNPARTAGLDQLALGIYQVRLFQRRADGSSALIAFRLLRSGGDDVRSRPENGFWWSVPTATAPALTGSGLSIEQQGSHVAVTLLSYEHGAPAWYFGSAAMPGNIVRIPLTRMVGGDEPFSAAGTPPTAEPGLTLNLQFLAPSHALGWLLRTDTGSNMAIQAQELDLLRLPFGSGHVGNAWMGEWALLEDESRQARIFDLVDLATADAESFRLRDRDGHGVLQCRIESIGGHPMPAYCTLLVDGSVLADFDHNGLDRLSGIDPGGHVIRLVRLPR